MYVASTKASGPIEDQFMSISNVTTTNMWVKVVLLSEKVNKTNLVH